MSWPCYSFSCCSRSKREGDAPCLVLLGWKTSCWEAENPCAPKGTQCPLLAISGHPDGDARTSALPPKADIGGARTVAIQKADIGCLQLCIVFIGPAETRLDLTTVCRVNLPWRIADITLGTIALGTRQTVQVFQHLLNCWRIPHLVIEL